MKQYLHHTQRIRLEPLPVMAGTIIIGHSQFERIPISRERQERLLYEQIDEITDGIAEVEASGGERFTVKQLERTRKSLEARLEKLQAEGRKDDVVTFEQLGVSYC